MLIGTPEVSYTKRLTVRDVTNSDFDRKLVHYSAFAIMRSSFRDSLARDISPSAYLSVPPTSPSETHTPVHIDDRVESVLSCGGLPTSTPRRRTLWRDIACSFFTRISRNDVLM